MATSAAGSWSRRHAQRPHGDRNSNSGTRIINRGTCGALSVDLAAAKEMVAILVVKDQYQLLEKREVR